MKADERVQLGAGPIRVSRLGIGCGSQSNAQGAPALESMLEECWAAGLRHFDTAPLYADGDSERRLGAFLRNHDSRDYVVSTKVGRLPAPPGERRFDYSTGGTRASIEESLTRLGLDRIDLVLIHDLDREMHADFEARYAEVLEQTYPVLDELRDSGTIGAIGLSSRQPCVCLRVADEVRIDTFMLAGSYTLLNHEPLAKLLPFCADRDIGVLLASPFNTGILATGSPASTFEYHAPSPEILARVSAMSELCARHGVPLPAAALQFPLLHPAITGVVVGHRMATEVRRNVAAIEQVIPPALWWELKAKGLLPEDAPTG
ncbi:MAG: aldo/keto reductase [Actinomycetota bacterium]|nr:aldo/keto reductase [Actinomycetota bacterium]